MDDKLLKFAYDMAFRDATLRNAFIKYKSDESEESDEHFRSRKKLIRDGAFNDVKKYIDLIFAGCKPDPLETIICISDKFREKGFSFGNAQKLVNMTSKYMYLTTYYVKDSKELFENCHCPMDSIMIDVVKKMSNTYKYKDISWSRLDVIDNKIPQEYNDFQTEIVKLSKEEGCIPIEFDYLFWDNE